MPPPVPSAPDAAAGDCRAGAARCDGGGAGGRAYTRARRCHVRDRRARHRGHRGSASDSRQRIPPTALHCSSLQRPSCSSVLPSSSCARLANNAHLAGLLDARRGFWRRAVLCWLSRQSDSPYGSARSPTVATPHSEARVVKLLVADEGIVSVKPRRCRMGRHRSRDRAGEARRRSAADLDRRRAPALLRADQSHALYERDRLLAGTRRSSECADLWNNRSRHVPPI